MAFLIALTQDSYGLLVVLGSSLCSPGLLAGCWIDSEGLSRSLDCWIDIEGSLDTLTDVSTLKGSFAGLYH